ncbi:MAG: peptidase S8 [Armatimonadetes bacterium]|nr:peptidase S8 [Armatimonadota bacterium]
MQAVAVSYAAQQSVYQAKLAAIQATHDTDSAPSDNRDGAFEAYVIAADALKKELFPDAYAACEAQGDTGCGVITDKWIADYYAHHDRTVRVGDSTLNVDATGEWHGKPVSASSLIAGAEPMKPGKGTRPNDPLYDSQWNFRMVGAEDAWAKTRGKGVIVAVIDTGVAAETTKKGKQCRDFNTTSFVKGYDFVNKDADAFDDHGHGTHVAGTIAESTNNNEGVAGLAYESTIMPLKVLGANGSGNSSDIADAIRFAADNGAKIINMSLGSSQPSSVIQKACQYALKKGVTIVCAAGNSSREGVGYPAAFPECVAISSVGPTGELARYSSWGEQVALAAPGGDMMQSGEAKDGILQNTILRGERGKGDDYYAFQGTSMASPHAAAVAALVASQGVTDPARVRDILTKSATPAGEPKKFGAGILSAANAVSMTSAVEGFKLRHLLLLGGAVLILGIGPRRSFWTRAGMLGALGAGFFGADAAQTAFGANSAWNLLTFSAALPAVAYFAGRKSLGGAKVAGTFALGTAVCLWAGWHNDLHPFTDLAFGTGAAHPWTFANMGAAFVIANLAGWKAVKLAGVNNEPAK